jgi:hypothetical protein
LSARSICRTPRLARRPVEHRDGTEAAGIRAGRDFEAAQVWREEDDAAALCTQAVDQLRLFPVHRRHAPEPQARRLRHQLAGLRDGAVHLLEAKARLRRVGDEAAPVGRRGQERQPSEASAEGVQQPQGPCGQQLEQAFHWG